MTRSRANVSPKLFSLPNAPRVSCRTRQRLEGEACGIPHLAKNERDVGHPAIAAGIEPKCVLELGFVSGHDFSSRAINDRKYVGL
jgi:hypothetical protein